MQEFQEYARKLRVEAEHQQQTRQEQDKALVEKLVEIYDQKAIAELCVRSAGATSGLVSHSIVG